MTPRIPVIAPTKTTREEWDYMVNICKRCIGEAARRRALHRDLDTKFLADGRCVFCRSRDDVRKVCAFSAKEIGEALTGERPQAPWVGLFSVCKGCGVFTPGAMGAMVACSCESPPVLSPVQMASWGPPWMGVRDV